MEEMRLTPIEIRSHRFNNRMRGYDAAEVDAFIETVVSDFEEVVRENARVRRESERLARELETHRSREKTIQDTLTTAQEVVDQLKRTAMKEAEVMIGEAELRSEKMLEQSRARLADLDTQIGELRHLRGRLSADLRATLDGYRSRIEAYDDSCSN